jgi:hypothetical protein
MSTLVAKESMSLLTATVNLLDRHQFRKLTYPAALKCVSELGKVLGGLKTAVYLQRKMVIHWLEEQLQNLSLMLTDLLFFLHISTIKSKISKGHIPKKISFMTSGIVCTFES